MIIIFKANTKLASEEKKELAGDVGPCRTHRQIPNIEADDALCHEVTHVEQQKGGQPHSRVEKRGRFTIDHEEGRRQKICGDAHDHN